MARAAAPRTTAPTPVPRKDGQRRREALLDAALVCFARAGVFGVGIEDIRREANASPSSVYHQFSGIDEIMLALLERIFQRLFAHLAQRVGRRRTSEGSVRALVDGHIEWIAAHPVEGRFMYQAITLEVGGLRDTQRVTLAETKDRLLAPVVAHFAPFIERGELPEWPPLVLDVVLLGPAHEALRRYLAGNDALDPAMLRRVLPTLAWKSVAQQRRVRPA